MSLLYRTRNILGSGWSNNNFRVQETHEKLLCVLMAKAWEDKSQWLTHCSICFCAVTYQLMDFHLQYHEQIDPNSAKFRR